MMPGFSFQLDEPGAALTTVGLAKHGLYDFRVAFADGELAAEAEAFARYIINYQRESGRKIRPNETAVYGYWTTRFVPGPSGVLDVWEAAVESDKGPFVPGAAHALRCWQAQRDLCATLKVQFRPPHASQQVAITDGVLEGDYPMEGIRYPANDPHAGWFFSTDRYNGDPRSLRMVHLEHLTEVRPEVTPFLALPFGFGFELKPEEQVSFWFDEEDARRDPI